MPLVRVLLHVQVQIQADLIQATSEVIRPATHFCELGRHKSPTSTQEIPRYGLYVG